MTKEEIKYPCETCEKKYCHQNCKRFNEWKDKAVEALEKQIAKKPADITNYGDVISWNCPNCGREFRSWTGYKVCHNCGQILDWGDEE